MTDGQRHPASFKDPAGFVFELNGIVYRHVGQAYVPHYQQLMSSGLYTQLTENGQLIAHEEVDQNLSGITDFYVTLKPQRIAPISYPYEWSFDQFKDAALLTLSIMRTALSHGMILKDATPYNIQFQKGRPVFIDTLSFEIHDVTAPWVAYKQFCEMFLNPLLLEHYTGVESISWLRTYLTGIPASVTARLLPRKAKWSLAVWLYVLLPQKIRTTQTRPVHFSLKKMQQLIQHLTSTIESLRPSYPPTTTWNNYYSTTILGPAYLAAKESLMLEFMQGYEGKTIIDLGANDGHFSWLFAEKAQRIIAADMDAACINRLYLRVREQGRYPIYPITQQLANPSPDLGFHQKERAGFIQRCQSEMVWALALIHHLTIGDNIPFTQVASFLSELGPNLIIEFVDKSDEKVQQMLSTRKDIFEDYHEEAFEKAFQTKYSIVRKEVITGTHRTLYLMQTL